MLVDARQWRSFFIEAKRYKLPRLLQGRPVAVSRKLNVAVVSEQANMAKTGGGPARLSNPHGDLIAYILGTDTELIEGVNGQ